MYRNDWFTIRFQSNVALAHENLAKAVAKQVVQDGIKAPVCLTERTHFGVNGFCHSFYSAYNNEYNQQSISASYRKANIQNVVHTVNLSTEDAMNTEFEDVLTTLRTQHYDPDAFITFSEYVFDMINNVSTRREGTLIFSSN